MKSVFLFLSLLMIPGYGYSYTYAGWSDTVFSVSLDGKSDLYPSKGTTYSIPFNLGKRYYGSFDIPPNSNDTGTTMYAAKYAEDYNMDGGYAVLSDSVKVKSEFWVSSKYRVVPFTDINNGYTEPLNRISPYSSGSKGIISLVITKTILQGEILIPSFTVYLYSHMYNPASYTSSYDYSKPLVTVNFPESTLQVEKICDVSNTPINTIIKDAAITDVFNGNKIGDVTVSIKCVKDVDDLNISLMAKGTKNQFDSSYFSTSHENIGINLSKDGTNINETNGYKFSMGGVLDKDISIGIYPFLYNKKTIINGDITSDIKIILMSDD